MTNISFINPTLIINHLNENGLPVLSHDDHEIKTELATICPNYVYSNETGEFLYEYNPDKHSENFDDNLPEDYADAGTLHLIIKNFHESIKDLPCLF